MDSVDSVDSVDSADSADRWLCSMDIHARISEFISIQAR